MLKTFLKNKYTLKGTFFFKKLKKTNVPVLDYHLPQIKQRAINLFASKSFFDVTKFIQQYVLNFLEYFLKYNVVFSIASNDKDKKLFFAGEDLLLILKLVQPYHMKVGKGLFLSEMIDVILIAFSKKDLNVFKN